MIPNNLYNIQNCKIRLLHLKKQILNLSNKPNKNRFYNSNFIDNPKRKNVIFNVLKYTSDIMEFKPETFHLSLNIFNSLLSKFNLSQNLYVKLSLLSLSLASKIKESQVKAFSTIDLTYSSNFSLNDLYELEKKVLISLEFNLNIKSSFDFLKVFLTFREIIFIKKENNFISHDLLELYMPILENVTFIVTTEYEERKFNPLVITLVIIMITRKLCGFEIIFPEVFNFLTGYKEENLNECFNLMHKIVINKQKLFINVKSDCVHACSNETKSSC